MNTATAQPVFQTTGHCCLCNQTVEFVAYDHWFRDYFICSHCYSIPRERALMTVIENYYPQWRGAVIHESSPSQRGASQRLKTECVHYIASQYFPEHTLGSTVNDVRCENLEQLTFADASIDLHITQDVLEHVFHPERVFQEIARTLKPGGMHIFTVPLVKKQQPSRRRAQLDADQNTIIHLVPEQYHGNPIGDGRSLVTIDWGMDICQYIFRACGLFTHVIVIDDLSKGIRAEYIEVLVTMKPAAALNTNDLL